MKGNGNHIGTLFEKLFFYCIPTSGLRTQYIIKHKNKFHHIGEKLFYQPRKFPTDPELISIGNNVKISSGVEFINHDIIHSMINDKIGESIIKPYSAPIQIDDNVMIGANVLIMPNVRICSDVIIAAGSIVTKDISCSGVYGGVPAKYIKSLEEFMDKRNKNDSKNDSDCLWKYFYKNHCL